jgi:hypothetical protein
VAGVSLTLEALWTAHRAKQAVVFACAALLAGCGSGGSSSANVTQSWHAVDSCLEQHVAFVGNVAAAVAAGSYSQAGSAGAVPSARYSHGGRSGGTSLSAYQTLTLSSPFVRARGFWFRCVGAMGAGRNLLSSSAGDESDGLDHDFEVVPR